MNNQRKVNKKILLLIIGILVIVTIFLGVVYSYYRPTSTPVSNVLTNKTTKIDDIPDNFKIERSSMGGETGKGDGLNVVIKKSSFEYSDNNTTKGTEISPRKTIELYNLVNKMKFFELDDRYPKTPACCDFFSTKITISSNQQTKTVVFDNYNYDQLPDHLMELNLAIRNIINTE